VDAVGRAAIGRAALAIDFRSGPACSQGAHGPSLEMLAQYIGKLPDHPAVRTKLWGYGASCPHWPARRRGAGFVIASCAPIHRHHN
jgi:hypothetical protein